MDVQSMNKLINKVITIASFSGVDIPQFHVNAYIRLKLPAIERQNVLFNYIYSPLQSNIIVRRCGEPARQTWGSLDAAESLRQPNTKHTCDGVRAHVCWVRAFRVRKMRLPRLLFVQFDGVRCSSLQFGSFGVRKTPSSVHLSCTHVSLSLRNL